MKSYSMTELIFELITIENEKKSLYKREKEIKERIENLYDSIKNQTRKGKTIKELGDIYGFQNVERERD